MLLYGRSNMKKALLFTGVILFVFFFTVAAKKTLVHIIDQSLCNQCGECVKACKYNAIKVTEADGKKKYEIDPVLCTQCGACIDVCPENAIKVVDKKKLKTAVKDNSAAKKTE
jgi:NAD-dependent dihydropyrimidine dehydrogenase PreA subunit